MAGDLDTTDDEILASLRAAELESLPASEWGQALAVRLQQVEESQRRLERDLEPLRAAGRVARSASKRAWVSLGGGGAALVAVIGIVIAWAGNRGEARGDARAERRQIADDHKTLVELKEELVDLQTAHAELLGLVRGLYPLRALPAP
jgi:hypothetical protein